METFKLEIDSMRSLQSRFVKCKLVMLALMWMQYDEDQQRIESANYSSPLLVDNSEWWDRNGGPDVEHFRKVSNTVRIGAWDEVMSLRLVDLLSPNPTCLHDASYYALVAIAMYLVDSDLNGTKKSSKLYGIRATALKAIEQWRRQGSGGRLMQCHGSDRRKGHSGKRSPTTGG